jgi:cytoskeletal protein CcmA (bactofilin family)
MSQNGNDTGQPKQTIVEEGTALRGSLASNGNVLVMGRVDGEVSGVAVEITETGAVSGRVKTPALRSRGELRGEIEATDVELSGQVLDDTVIRAQVLAVTIPTSSNGPTMLFGDCELEIGEAPQNTYVANDPPAKPRPGGGRRRRGHADEEAR